jgi:hypothetical protein
MNLYSNRIGLRKTTFSKDLFCKSFLNEYKMRLVIRDKTVEGYINDATQPSLTVEKLNDRHEGKVGLFMGDGAGWDFEKIVVNSHH